MNLVFCLFSTGKHDVMKLLSALFKNYKRCKTDPLAVTKYFSKKHFTKHCKRFLLLRFLFWSGL